MRTLLSLAFNACLLTVHVFPFFSRQARIVQLERALSSVMGENWEVSCLFLDLSRTVSESMAYSQEKLELEGATVTRSTSMRKRQSMQPAPVAAPPPSSISPVMEQQNDTQHASLQQIRMLILGMEKRLESRTEQLEEEISKADAEGRRYRELAAASS